MALGRPVSIFLAISTCLCDSLVAGTSTESCNGTADAMSALQAIARPRPRVDAMTPEEAQASLDKLNQLHASLDDLTPSPSDGNYALAVSAIKDVRKEAQTLARELNKCIGGKCSATSVIGQSMVVIGTLATTLAPGSPFGPILALAGGLFMNFFSSGGQAASNFVQPLQKTEMIDIVRSQLVKFHSEQWLTDFKAKSELMVSRLRRLENRGKEVFEQRALAYPEGGKPNMSQVPTYEKVVDVYRDDVRKVTDDIAQHAADLQKVYDDAVRDDFWGISTDNSIREQLKKLKTFNKDCQMKTCPFRWVAKDGLYSDDAIMQWLGSAWDEEDCHSDYTKSRDLMKIILVSLKIFQFENDRISVIRATVRHVYDAAKIKDPYGDLRNLDIAHETILVRYRLVTVKLKDLDSQCSVADDDTWEYGSVQTYGAEYQARNGGLCVPVQDKDDAKDGMGCNKVNVPMLKNELKDAYFGFENVTKNRPPICQSPDGTKALRKWLDNHGEKKSTIAYAGAHPLSHTPYAEGFPAA